MSTETVFPEPQGADQPTETWWQRYSVAVSGMTTTARKVLAADCHYIVDRGIFGPGPPRPSSWPSSRSRRGLVMGSVQSGKTASMLGTVALSLDRGVDIVVVLAGTRVSLWQQTLDRLRSQLDDGPDSAEKQRRRLLIPKSPATAQIPLELRYQLTPVRVRRALQRRQPLIIVALKHAGHLQALGQSLRASVLPEIDKIDRPVHMLVVDDEADDGSVLDAHVEAMQDPIYGSLKQIPRAIVDLWAPPSIDAPENLFATYVGYTATPQANFLQEDVNPLAPRDFLITLRTPFDRGNLEARESTFAEPAGLHHYYTGGETYYHRGHHAHLCVPTSSLPNDDLADAVRAFLVAGAIRLHRDASRLGPRSAAERRFESDEAARAAAPEPHSMLLHPSALVGDHFAAAEMLLEWAGAPDRTTARASIASGNAYLGEGLLARLDQEEAKWAVWAERYRESARAVHLEFDTQGVNLVPDWPILRDLLEREVITGTRVAVVNSDPDADDQPEYDPRESADGVWRAPRDMSTIFVSGNVMSRGLTLRGLTTTLFLRTSESPRADTQMQMQRWFGYRGSHIELCRVFAPEAQLRLFEQYHDVDEAVRNVVAEAMNDSSSVPTPVVLQGSGFLATGKIANLGNKPLHPGRKPFIRLINAGDEEDPNSRLVASLFSREKSVDVRGGARVRGRILENPLSLLDAAALIDALSYDDYQPGIDSQIANLWAQVEARVSAVQPLETGRSLYRAPAASRGPDSAVRKDCPYSIPAYFRLWDACLSRHVRGLFIAGSRGDLWSRTNLGVKAAQQPKFWVGIRYGGGNTVASGPLSKLDFGIPTTQRDVAEHTIRTTWGSNDPTAEAGGYRGDEFFDFYHRKESDQIAGMDDDLWRPPGEDGLILFYVNQLPGQSLPTIATGVCIPSGGPDQFAAHIPTQAQAV